MKGLLARISALALVVGALAGPTSSAQAQTYPDRRITMLVGFSAGSGADIQARYFAAKIAEVTGANGQSSITRRAPTALSLPRR